MHTIKLQPAALHRMLTITHFYPPRCFPFYFILNFLLHLFTIAFL